MKALCRFIAMSVHGFSVHVFSMVLQRQADHVVLNAVVQGLHLSICTVAPGPRCACVCACMRERERKMIQKMSEFNLGILTWISYSCNFGGQLNKGLYF